MHYSTAKVQRQAGFFAISGLSFVYFDEAFYAEHFNYNSHRLSRQENHLLYIKMYKIALITTLRSPPHALSASLFIRQASLLAYSPKTILRRYQKIIFSDRSVRKYFTNNCFRFSFFVENIARLPQNSSTFQTGDENIGRKSENTFLFINSLIFLIFVV